MKKYFLSLVAIAAMLFATSCQESLVEPQMEGPTTFTVQLPDGMGTKAIGDKENVNQLLVAVYSDVDNDQQPLVCKTVDVQKGTGRFDVSFDLIKGQTYDLIFWAQTGNAYVNGTQSYDLRTINIENRFYSNENGAAFYAYQTYVIDGQPKEATLRRPFAQLNIGTTVESLKTDADSDIILEGANIEVRNVASSFNTVTGFGEGTATIYGETDLFVKVAGEDIQVNNNQKYAELKVEGKSYVYVTMDYLPIISSETVPKDLVEIKLLIDTDQPTVIEHNFDNVPVQRNYRTNIVGNLISSTTDFIVKVSDDWADPDNNIVKTEVSNATELQAAIENTVGGEIVLTNDIDLTETLIFGETPGTGTNSIARASATEVPSFVLDLGGKTIKGAMHKNDGAVIMNNGTLTIKNGTISSTANNGGSAIQNNGTLTVEGATLNGAPNADGSWPSYTVNNTGVMTATNTTFTSYHGSVASYGEGAIVTLNDSEIIMAGIPGFTSHGIYTYSSGKVVVNGGTYANKATDQASSGASVINGAVEVNAGTFNGRIENYYGTPVLKGGTYSVKPNNNFIAAGYKAMEKDGKFYVVEENVGIIITNPNQLTSDVIKEYSNIYLAAPGKYLANLYNIDKKDNLTITGTEGVQFAHTADKYGQLRIEQIKNFTIRNCEILQREVGDRNWGMMVFSTGISGGRYTIENCTFNGVGTQGIYINQTQNESPATYNIINCTFNGNFGDQGAITISTHQGVKHTVNVTDCKFNKVPADHRIYLTEGETNKGLFYDFTLNTDLEVATANELVMFLSLRSDVVFANDIKIDPANMSNAYGKTGINVKYGQTINGNGYTLNIKGAGGTWDSGINTTGGLIKNITVTGSFRGIFINHTGDYSEKVVLENVTIGGNGTVYTISCDQGKNQGIEATNCTFNGWTSFAKTAGEAKFVNCYFGEGSGYKYCRPYSKTEFVNCTFCPDYTVDESQAEVTFTNCTFEE